MTLNSQESFLKKWIDRLLVIDFFLVVFGFVWFLVAIVLQIQGFDEAWNTFQLFWLPFFIPAISLLITASLFNALVEWWQNREPD